MRNAVVSTLSGNVETMKDMIGSNHFKPIEIAHWSGERRGVNANGTLDSFQLAQAMSDALQREKLYSSLNVEAMWQLHKDLLPGLERTSYDQLGFIIWNRFDRPGDNPYFDKEDEKELLTTGVSPKDISLTNFGIQHMEKEVVELLKAGASPYFLVTAPYFITHLSLLIYHLGFIHILPLLIRGDLSEKMLILLDLCKYFHQYFHLF